MLSFSLGPLVISVEQALAAIALVVAIVAGRLAARRRDVSVTDTLFNLALAGILAARVVFVLRYVGEYRDEIWRVIDIRDGGFDALGGLAGMGLYAALVIRQRPELRRPLGAALLAGALTWGLTGGALGLIETEAATLPNAPLQTLDAQPTDLATLQRQSGGKPMVVNLWATWCPPCRAEMPLLQRAQQARPDTLFVFVNQGESSATIDSYIVSQRLDLEHSLRDPGRRLARHVGANGLPTTLFYDASGRLVDSHLGQLSKATLRDAMRHLEPAPAE